MSGFAADEDEVVEVIASHYVAAYEAAPDAEDAEEIKEKAQRALVRAGERASSLAAAAEACRYFEQAAEMTAHEADRASLFARGGEMASWAADPETARRLLEASIAIYEDGGDTHAAARVSGKLARVDAFTDRRDEGLARAERAFEVIANDEPDEDLGLLAARLALGYWFGGDIERASERAELALEIGESLGSPEVLIHAMRAKGAIALSCGHREEAVAFIKHTLALALENDIAEDAGIAYSTLSDSAFHRDRYPEALAYLEQSLVHSRRMGHRTGEWSAQSESTYAYFMLGRWEEALAAFQLLSEAQARSGGMYLSLLTSVLEIHVHRGELDEARQLLSLFSRLKESTDLQDKCCWAAGNALLARAEGRYADALADGIAAVDIGGENFGLSHQAVEQGLVEAIEAALALGEPAKAEELLAKIDSAPPGRRPQLLRAQAMRIRARLEADEVGFRAAAALFAEMEIPFLRAVTLLEQAEALGNNEARTEARAIFERLHATPWLARAEREAAPLGAASA